MVHSVLQLAYEEYGGCHVRQSAFNVPSRMGGMAVRVRRQGRPGGRKTATREMTRQLDQVYGYESGRARYRDNTRPIEFLPWTVDQEESSSMLLHRWQMVVPRKGRYDSSRRLGQGKQEKGHRDHD
jgi:hypothetical protein